MYKLRAFADIGRAQGIAVTASIAIGAAITTGKPIHLFHIIFITLISAFAHTLANTYIALGDLKLDSYTYVPERNVVAQGIISEKSAYTYIYSTFLITILLNIFFLSFVAYPYNFLAFICFYLSAFFVLFYGYKGKKYLLAYDYLFAISYFFYALYGVYSVEGAVTKNTLLFIFAVLLAGCIFAQWENSFKDAYADAKAGVRSLAVLTNVHKIKKLAITHIYAIYGILIKILLICVCFAVYLLTNYIYLIFILIYIIPSQIFILYRFLTKEKPIEHRKTILLDVAFSGIIVYSTLYTISIWAVIFLSIYLILGYLIGSSLQSSCEFKFRKFSSGV